jgi:hypothetical protein
MKKKIGVRNFTSLLLGIDIDLHTIDILAVTIFGLFIMITLFVNELQCIRCD